VHTYGNFEELAQHEVCPRPAPFEQDLKSSGGTVVRASPELHTSIKFDRYCLRELHALASQQIPAAACCQQGVCSYSSHTNGEFFFSMLD